MYVLTKIWWNWMILKARSNSRQKSGISHHCALWYRCHTKINFDSIKDFYLDFKGFCIVVFNFFPRWSSRAGLLGTGTRTWTRTWSRVTPLPFNDKRLLRFLKFQKKKNPNKQISDHDYFKKTNLLLKISIAYECKF